MEAMIEGTAPTPFQHRILVPAAVGALHRGMADIPLVIVWQTVEVALAVGLMVALAVFLRIFVASNALCMLLSLLYFNLLVFCLILPVEGALLHPYDVASVLLFTICLTLMRRERWIAYLAVFTLGTLNRDTTCFLVFIFLFTSFRRMPWPRVVALGALQAALWLAVKVALWSLHRESGGPGVFETWHLEDNLAFAASPANLAHLVSGFGFLMLPVLVFARLIPDAFLRRSLWVLVPLLLTAMVMGAIHEPRIYIDLFPIFAAGHALILLELARRAQPSR
jgi:hypothetical protein